MPVSISETTWLEGVVEMAINDGPDGLKLMSLVLQNGHRYIIPLDAKKQSYVQQRTSRLAVVGAEQLPHTNGDT